MNTSPARRLHGKLLPRLTGLPAKASHPAYHANMIKIKKEIVCRGGLPRLGGLPHLPEVPHLHVNRPFGIIKRRDGHVDRLEQGLREGIVSMLRRRTNEVVIDLRKDFKVIIYGGEFSAFKDFEKVIQVLELYRRRENNH